jgi:hypothetical protein
VVVPTGTGVVPVTFGTDYGVTERHQNGANSLSEGGFGHIAVGVSDWMAVGLQGGYDSSGALSGGPYVAVAGVQGQVNATTETGVDVGLYNRPSGIEVGVNIQGSYYDELYLIATTERISNLGGYQGLGSRWAQGYQYDPVVMRTTNPWDITAWFARLDGPPPPYVNVP